MEYNLNVIDEKYMPFTREQMKRHFLIDADRQIDYFMKSAKNYHDFHANLTEIKGIPISESKESRQIEKDERFWTAACLKHIFDHEDRTQKLESILAKTFGAVPPVEGLRTWIECVSGNLELYFEAQAPSPRGYTEWLKQNLLNRQFIPYVLDAAARDNLRPLEGPTHFDAVFVNPSNGFSLLIESKVLSDASPTTNFDILRNQLTRCIDVMLESYAKLPGGFGQRNPDRTLFTLLTPEIFRLNPHSRLYGWLIAEYQSNPEALARDLPHRTSVEWPLISSRLGWITFEDIEMFASGACPWIHNSTIN